MVAQITDDLATQIVEMGRGGKRIFEIIRATGLTRNTIADRLRRAGIGPAMRPMPQPDQFTTYEAIHGPKGAVYSKPRVRVKAGSSPILFGDDSSEPLGAVKRVVVVADQHDNPSLPQHRFSHIGKFVADTAPDYLVNLGDLADFEFASRFEEWGSIHGRERSPFRDEMDSLLSAMERLQTPLTHMSKPPKKIVTLGNHDERVWLFENSHPECEGMMWAELSSALSEWEVYPYRQFAFVGGVGFTHAPHNAAGKPYMGKTPENQIANDAAFSIVSGHTHKSAYRTAPKLGPQNQISVFNPGCALPYGYIKPYAALSMTGWSWGVGVLTIRDGRILGHEIVPMDVLSERYG